MSGLHAFTLRIIGGHFSLFWDWDGYAFSNVWSIGYLQVDWDAFIRSCVDWVIVFALGWGLDLWGELSFSFIINLPIHWGQIRSKDQSRSWGKSHIVVVEKEGLELGDPLIYSQKWGNKVNDIK